MRLLALLLTVSGFCALAETKLGKPLTLPSPTPVARILASPNDYVNKLVQVRGTVTEVCQKMGCWMALADPESGGVLRVKVKDGEIVFPKESVGKTAIAEGKLVKIELTKEQAIAAARHEAEEQGRKFDPSSITGGKTFYQVQGAGAVVK